MMADEAHRRAVAGEILLVDVRNPDEWRRTGLGEGAHAISMQDPDLVAKVTQAAGGDKARPVALICAAGARSAHVAAVLARNGFTDLHNVDEGMMGSAAGPGWLGRRLPVTTEA